MVIHHKLTFSSCCSANKSSSEYHSMKCQGQGLIVACIVLCCVNVATCLTHDPVNHRFWFWTRFLRVLVLKTFAESLENVFEFYRRFEDVLITFLKLENGLIF